MCLKLNRKINKLLFTGKGQFKYFKSNNLIKIKEFNKFLGLIKKFF